MYVTRLKRGYRISCSDTEMSVLRFLVGQGVQEMGSAGDWEWPQDPAERRIVRSERWESIVGPLVTDDDRRQPIGEET